MLEMLLSRWDLVLALTVFVGCLFLFLFEKIDKTMVALGGAVLLVAGGVMSFEEAMHSIDFETLILLIGLMFVVGVAHHSGLFSWMNVQIAKKSSWNPLLVFLFFSLLTFFASTILNNATVVLLMVPIAVSLGVGLGLNTKLLVISVAIMSNIGGTWTLIGDAPNTLIGMRVGLSFMSFIENLTVPVVIMTVLSMIYMVFANWKSLKPMNQDLTKMMISDMIISRIAYKYADNKMNPYIVSVTLATIVASIVALIFQPQLGIAVGVIGMFFGVLIGALVSHKISFMTLIKEDIEWDSILFFAALFVQVGALEKVGFLKMITEAISQYSGNVPLLLMVIVWGIGIASMFINNIPFVALMIPVIKDLQVGMAGQPHLDLLWWALALGACLGGNGTIIGSASGVIAVDLAKKMWVRISFAEFSKVGVPVTLVTLVVSSIYLLAVYYLWM